MHHSQEFSSSSMRSVAPWLDGDANDRLSLGTTVSCIVERELDVHEHLFLEGERQTHVYLVLSGLIGIYKLLADGRRQISTFAYPGDMIGLDCTDTHVDSGEALSGSRVRCIPVNAIEKLIMNEPGFGQTLLRIAANELADTRERMLSLGRQSATEKLATFLVKVARRNAGIGLDRDTVHIPMKRCEIADFLGLTIETVSRNFTRLKLAGVIRLKSNSQVELVDFERLEAIAKGDMPAHLN